MKKGKEEVPHSTEATTLHVDCISTEANFAWCCCIVAPYRSAAFLLAATECERARKCMHIVPSAVGP